MKRISAIALFVAASFITAGSALAQDHAVKATIPFSFTVSGSTLPAGVYTIATDSTRPNLLRITDREKGAHAMVIAVNGSGQKSDNKVSFHRYGNQYFLSSIRADSTAMNVYLPTSKLEKRAKTQTQEASLSPDDSNSSSGDITLALY